MSATPSYRRDSNHEATAGWTGADDFFLVTNHRSMKGDDADRVLRKAIGSTVRRKQYMQDSLEKAKKDPKFQELTPTVKQAILHYRFHLEKSVAIIADLLKTEPEFVLATIGELLAIQDTKK